MTFNLRLDLCSPAEIIPTLVEFLNTIFSASGSPAINTQRLPTVQLAHALLFLGRHVEQLLLDFCACFADCSGL